MPEPVPVTLYLRIPPELRARINVETARRAKLRRELASLNATAVALLTERLNQIEGTPARKAGRK